MCFTGLKVGDFPHQNELSKEAISQTVVCVRMTNSLITATVNCSRIVQMMKIANLSNSDRDMFVDRSLYEVDRHESFNDLFNDQQRLSWLPSQHSASAPLRLDH